MSNLLSREITRNFMSWYTVQPKRFLGALVNAGTEWGGITPNDTGMDRNNTGMHRNDTRMKRNDTLMTLEWYRNEPKWITYQEFQFIFDSARNKQKTKDYIAATKGLYIYSRHKHSISLKTVKVALLSVLIMEQCQRDQRCFLRKKVY